MRIGTVKVWEAKWGGVEIWRMDSENGLGGWMGEKWVEKMK